MATATLDDQVKHLFKASAKEPTLLRIPPMKYLMIDGTGDPNTSEEFQHAIQALYSLAYTIKFSRKKKGEASNYKITPLEGLWWSDDPHAFEAGSDKAKWEWTLMIAQPSIVSQHDLKDAVKYVLAKDPNALVEHVRLAPFKEGPAVQMMHVGPYSAEGKTIEKLLAFAKEQGYTPSGKHHEIYLGDPRRSKPENLKTIVRHPVLLRKKK